jgi:hypothetical protein
MTNEANKLSKREKLRISGLYCRLVATGVRVIAANSETIMTERDKWSLSQNRYVKVLEEIPATKEGVSNFIQRQVEDSLLPVS